MCVLICDCFFVTKMSLLHVELVSIPPHDEVFIGECL